MRKSTLFISAALTSFMLVVLFGVVSAYKSISSSTQQAAVLAQPTAAMVQVVNAPITAPVVSVTPEEAAAIASKVIGRTDLYSVEGIQFEGVDAYLVTFSSGDIVYISMDGQVLSISKIAVTVISQPNNGGGGGNNNNSHRVSNGEGEHEGGDD